MLCRRQVNRDITKYQGWGLTEKEKEFKRLLDQILKDYENDAKSD